MKIFITVGTQDKPFKRLIDMAEELALNYDIYIQNGFTEYKGNIAHSEYLDKDEMSKKIKEADLIISHGGVGSITEALKLNKKVIAVARLAKYGEHQHDHQLEIIEAFKKKGYILAYDEQDDINKLVLESLNFNPKPFISHTLEFNQKLKDYLATF